jgi:hypothetical protein
LSVRENLFASLVFAVASRIDNDRWLRSLFSSAEYSRKGISSS